MERPWLLEKRLDRGRGHLRVRHSVSLRGPIQSAADLDSLIGTAAFDPGGLPHDWFAYNTVGRTLSEATCDGPGGHGAIGRLERGGRIDCRSSGQAVTQRGNHGQGH